MTKIWLGGHLNIFNSSKTLHFIMQKMHQYIDDIDDRTAHKNKLQAVIS